MLLACLLAVLAAGPQDPAHEPTIPERVDALIAKSNAYEGFVAHYRLRAKEGSELTMRIVYNAPQSLVLDFQGDGFRSFTRLQPDSWDDIRFQSGSKTSRASVKNWNLTPGHARHMRAVFEEEYPGLLRAEDVPASEKPFIELRVGRESMSFSFGFGLAQCARLDWLARIRRAPERVSVAGDGNGELAFSFTDDLTMFVSCENGFITRLQKRTKTGDRFVIELVSVQTTRPAESEFALPDSGPEVGDFSEELEITTARMGFSNSRNNLFSALAMVIDDGRLKWMEETSAKVERIVRAVHAVDFRPVCTRPLAASRASIAKASATLAERVRDLEPGDQGELDQLAEQVKASRRDLEGALGQILGQILGQVLDEQQSQAGPRGKCKLRPSLYEELAAMEKPILSEMFAEFVTKPVLAEFDEKVAKQLDVK